ncbi:MAG: PDZ domain-containing protein [Candidatus Melainabacteria bacterium]|nr:PDZ domain-containing protein [Candidatus Melainabacteria bacterium]
MNNLDASRRLLSAAILSAVICSRAVAKEATDFSKLYKSKNYDQICKLFESDKSANWRNPNSAYFYALGLLGQGKTDAAIRTCKSIQQQYPKTEAAKLARSLVELWSKKSKPSSKTLITEHTGIVGLKFTLGFGLPPTVARVFPSTPAHQAGLQQKDIITAVDGVPTTGLTKEEIFHFIVGPPNTAVRIRISRDGIETEKQMTRMSLDKLKRIDPEVYRDYLMSI